MEIYKSAGSTIARTNSYLLIVFLWMSCTDPPPSTWKEFHGNSGNSGFTNFKSKIANKLKWQFPVGDVSYASPVVDEDGIIYIGNTTGDLFAINPDKTQKWKQHLVGRLSSPAIGASGTIYVTNIQIITATNQSSSLFSLNKDGTSPPNWWYAFPDHGHTTAPPKTFSVGKDEFIFVPAITDKGPELFTFINNREGTLLMSRSPANCIPDEIINEGIKNPFEFHIDPIAVADVSPTAAIAISTQGDGGDKKPVIVYAARNCHMMGFTLDPVQRSIDEIWVAPYVYSYYPTPAITNGGQIIVGHGKTLSAYNLMDGKKIWDYEDKYPLNGDNDGFYNCPAILLGTSPSYNLFHSRIIGLDEKGNQVHNFGLLRTEGNTTASPLVTTKFVYAAFPSGLFTLDLNLKEVHHIAFIPGPKTAVLSSPAIGPDGTIYMVDANGILEAFEEDPDGGR